MAKARSRKNKEGKPPPKCKAILLCDTIILDQLTGKTTIVGVFDSFNVPQFPGQTVPFRVFVQLTDGIGSYKLSVALINLHDGEILAKAELAEANFKDRATKHVLIIPVPPLPLPHEGVYDFVVFANGQEIDRQKFQARAIGENRDADSQEESPEDDEE